MQSLAKWARIKGIDLLGTGDFLHPLWQKELRANLRETGDGIYEAHGMKFVLTNEISCIYSDKGKVRRIHLLLVFPSFSSVEKFGAELLKRGVNITSDGRPIMGLSVKEVTKIIFEVEPSAILIPAHVWTPWFGLFGSQSGYDSLEDAFEEYAKEILAVETGLSAEPAMCWRIQELDVRSIVSNSDAHSMSKLGREVTVFDGKMSFSNLRDDLKSQKLVETIEFFPEEGKYHWSGHRNCGVIYSPADIKKKGEICPVCGRRLTIGVVQRVEKLASRTNEELGLTNNDGIVKSGIFPNRPGFRMLVGLEKIIAESFGVGEGSKKVREIYLKLVQELGGELKILTNISTKEIARVSNTKIAEGIERVRLGQISIQPGFDNTYGMINIWNNKEKSSKVQMGLFV